MDSTIISKIRLLQFHILRSFLAHFMELNDGDNLPITELLEKLVDRDHDKIAAIKALRGFGSVNYRFMVLQTSTSSPVYEALYKGLSEAGVNPIYRDGTGLATTIDEAVAVHCTFGKRGEIGLRDAKEMVEQLRMMPNHTC
jgi:hypothetical protein